MNIVTSASTSKTLTAVSAPVAGRPDRGTTPKRDRRLTLTKIDRRGRLGKRIAELTAVFAAAIARDKCHEASEA